MSALARAFKGKGLGLPNRNAGAGCRYYPPADLEVLKEEANQATPVKQCAALMIVADIFNSAAGFSYAVMGEMNYFLRHIGQWRTYEVDIAVTGTRKLEDTLNLLNRDHRIIRPKYETSWQRGIAVIFVEVDNHVVRINLKRQDGARHGLPPVLRLRETVDLIEIPTTKTSIRALAIGPLVKSKLHSYEAGGELTQLSPSDIAALRCVCIQEKHAAAIQEATKNVAETKRRALFRKIFEGYPHDNLTEKHMEDMRAVCRTLALNPRDLGHPEIASPPGRLHNASAASSSNDRYPRVSDRRSSSVRSLGGATICDEGADDDLSRLAQGNSSIPAALRPRGRAPLRICNPDDPQPLIRSNDIRPNRASGSRDGRASPASSLTGEDPSTLSRLQRLRLGNPTPSAVPHVPVPQHSAPSWSATAPNTHGSSSSRGNPPPPTRSQDVRPLPTLPSVAPQTNAAQRPAQAQPTGGAGQRARPPQVPQGARVRTAASSQNLAGASARSRVLRGELPPTPAAASSSGTGR